MSTLADRVAAAYLARTNSAGASRRASWPENDDGVDYDYDALLGEVETCLKKAAEAGMEMQDLHDMYVRILGVA